MAIINDIKCVFLGNNDFLVYNDLVAGLFNDYRTSGNVAIHQVEKRKLTDDEIDELLEKISILEEDEFEEREPTLKERNLIDDIQVYYPEVRYIIRAVYRLNSPDRIVLGKNIRLLKIFKEKVLGRGPEELKKLIPKLEEMVRRGGEEGKNAALRLEELKGKYGEDLSKFKEPPEEPPKEPPTKPEGEQDKQGKLPKRALEKRPGEPGAEEPSPEEPKTKEEKAKEAEKEQREKEAEERERRAKKGEEERKRKAEEKKAEKAKEADEKAPGADEAKEDKEAIDDEYEAAERARKKAVEEEEERLKKHGTPEETSAGEEKYGKGWKALLYDVFDSLRKGDPEKWAEKEKAKKFLRDNWKTFKANQEILKKNTELVDNLRDATEKGTVKPEDIAIFNEMINRDPKFLKDVNLNNKDMTIVLPLRKLLDEKKYQDALEKDDKFLEEIFKDQYFKNRGIDFNKFKNFKIDPNKTKGGDREVYIKTDLGTGMDAINKLGIKAEDLLKKL